jgi:hypothetical protein
MKRIHMRYVLTIAVALGLVSSGFTTRTWAQDQPRPSVRLAGRVIDQTRRPVEGVEVIVNRRRRAGEDRQCRHLQPRRVSR